MPSQPALRRVLSRTDLILYGLVILTPTAAYPFFGIVQDASRGHVALSYLVAMVGMLFTAGSYGKMAGAFPLAGSAYSYAGKAINAHVGFLAGWSMVLDYLLIPLLSVVYAALTSARLVPAVPYWVWAVLYSVAITYVNTRGIKSTAVAGRWLMAAMTIVAFVFAAAAINFLLRGNGAGTLFDVRAIYRPESFAAGPVLFGAALATTSYLGFDAISTLAEETPNPARDIGFATVSVCIFQTIICFITVYLASLAWPDYQTLPHKDTAILDISTRIGGAALFGLVTFILLVAGLASALTGQAGAARLLFGMGRDGVLPAVFGRVDPRSGTPLNSTLFMGACSLAGALLLHFELIVELLNFGAFVGFILVNLSVIAKYWIRERRRGLPAAISFLVFPALGALVCGFVWLNLTSAAKIAGFGWLAAGLVFLAVRTRGFRSSPVPLEVQ